MPIRFDSIRAARFIVGTLLVTLMLGAANTSAADDAPPSGRRQMGGREYPPKMTGAEEHLYKTVGDVKLNLYVFKPSDWKATDKRPAIVFFFGGGWTNGSPSQFEPECRHFAQRGMVAITADYRVKSRNNVTPVECVTDAK